MFELFCQEFLKVSSRIQENSRFLETRLGDRRINPLRARRGSTLRSRPARAHGDAGEVADPESMSAPSGNADIERASRHVA
jgi:hypothetical protein